MKLSEAILLGSTVVTPKAGGTYFTENQAGCALGMASIAKGCSFRHATRPLPRKERRTLGMERVWGDWVLSVVMRPCPCWRFRVPREMRIKDIIAHIFDYHVMKKRNWTLDRLVEWVQTVEPKNCDPGRTIDPELQAMNESQRKEELLAADEWQARVSAFTAKRSSAHRSEQRQGRSTVA